MAAYQQHESGINGVAASAKMAKTSWRHHAALKRRK